MALHKLILEDVFEEDLYTLIAIHCTIEDYRLAYLLNKYLGITLTRKQSGKDKKKEEVNYPVFEWEDEKQLINWSLVSNTYKKEGVREVNQESLFETQQKITKTFYLVPEHKTVNYFLKIDNEFSFSKEKFILNNILKIPQIATAYSIDTNQLKSKDNLIFS